MTHRCHPEQSEGCSNCSEGTKCGRMHD